MPRIPVAQRRQDFITAAVEVIASAGIDGATTRRIADQAKANVAMLHYCYDSKEDLFADVHQHVLATYRGVIDASGEQGDLSEAAQAILRGVLQCYLDSPTFTATAFELVNWARRQHGGDGIRMYEETFEALRTALRTSGDAKVDEDTVEEVAYTIAVLADGFGLNWMTMGDRDLAEAQVEVTVAVLRAWLEARVGVKATARTRVSRKRSA